MQNLVYTALGIAAGVGIPVMVAMSSAMGARIGNPFAAGMLVSVVGFVGMAAVLLTTGLPQGGLRWPAPTVLYAAGVFFALYIVAVTFLGPRIGVGNAVFLVLLGQLASAAVIDHFGLFGATVVPVGVKRAVGLVVMAAGVYLARKPV